MPLDKKRSSLLRTLSVNVTKSVGICGLVTFTEEIVNEKLHFLCSVLKDFSMCLTILWAMCITGLRRRNLGEEGEESETMELCLVQN